MQSDKDDKKKKKKKMKKKKKITENDEEENEDKVSIVTYLKFLLAFINSTMVSMTKYLNRFSNDYRYIRKVLAKEKKSLKVRLCVLIQFFLRI